MSEGPKKPPQRTVIAGQPGGFAPRPMPGAGQGGGQGAAQGAAQGGAQRTVIGAMPQMPPAGGGAAPQGFAPPPQGPGPGHGHGQGHGQDNPFATPADRSYGGTGDSPFAAPAEGRAWMGAEAQRDSFFPEMGRPEAPAPQAPSRKIPLDDALRAPAEGFGAGSNPLLAAAAGLLVLFGRLRSQVVDMEAMPLMTHVTRELEQFERRAIDRGASEQDALIAKYALCGTADDIVQNLPGTDRHLWIQYSMVARFFNRRTSGVGFFQEVEKALADPVRKYDLLELMLTCLQLGFEGQYRTMSGGDVQLQQVRRQIFETLRRVKPRGDDDIAPRWQGQEIAARRQGARVPVWAVACLAVAVLGGAYFGLRTLLIDDGGRVAERMQTLHPTEGIKIARSALPDRTSLAAVFAAPVEPVDYVPPEPEPTSQIERIREGLAEDIEAGNLVVDIRGNYIAVTANNLILFDSGRADVKSSFAEVAERVAKVLNDEPGDIRIVGHTDSVPLSGRGRFRNNQELSVARAESVAGVILPLLSDAERVVVDGLGESEPIATNDTAEGRAENRRVEILVRREDTRSEERF